MSWCSVCLLLLFLYRTNGKKGHLEDENDFCHCYSKFFERAILKSTCHNFVYSLFSTITRHIDNSILKGTLQFFHQNFGKGYWNENRWRYQGKDTYAKRALGRTLHQKRNHFSVILCASFSHKPSCWI